MSTANESPFVQASASSMTRFLSLPHELLQSVFGSITNFKPWLYTSAAGDAGTAISDEQLLLHSSDAEPMNLISTHRTLLGLSSEDGWLVFILSRHPYHLARSDRFGILSTITQALRRMNARVEHMHWSERETRANPHARSHRILPKEDQTRRGNASCQATSTKRYHAGVHTEEESRSTESVDSAQESTALSSRRSPSTTCALVLQRPIPVLKITSQDVRSFANTSRPADAIQLFSVLIAAALIMLAQCRITLLENLERLERDTPIPSIEPYESRDFATPKMSPQHDRLRSMSGSTVVESMPHRDSLSLSTISTVYSSSNDGSQKEVKCAEKRVSEERDLGTSSKRPKLSEYKQVSSGRVATLMDRFEKFHL